MIKKVHSFLEKNMGYFIAVLTSLFLFFGQGVRWYCMGGDTEAYYLSFAHHIETKPLYSLLMEGARRLFGNEKYMYAVAVFQMLLSVVCITIFVYYIKKVMNTGILVTLAAWLCALAPYIILLPEDVISHSLMTESLTYPLIYIYVVVLLKGIYESKTMYCYISVALAILLTLIRGQMLFLLAPSVICFVYILLRDKQKNELKNTQKTIWEKPLLNLLIFFVFVFLCIKGESLICEAYESYFFGAPRMSYSAQTLVQKAMFCADEEDEALFPDEITKEIFSETYEKTMEVECNYRYMSHELSDWKHTTGSFGTISYTLGDVITEVALSNNIDIDNQFEKEQVTLKYSDELSKKLIMKHPGRFLYVSLSMMPAGLISTVLFHKESIYGIIHMLTLLFYLVLGILSVWLFKRQSSKRVSEFAWLAITISLINVASSNLIHMGLQRYMSYTLGINWLAMCLVIIEIYQIVKEKRKND